MNILDEEFESPFISNTTTVKYVEPIEAIDSERNIRNYMEIHNENYYNARERLREQRYGGTPPDNYDSWGMYFKSL